MRDMSEYERPAWAISQWVRETGLLEDICEHGVGHPNRDFLNKNDLPASWGVHGCDGCCSK